ncbi:MAG: asparaginase [Magnetospirillum sp.]|nr:asparaginase [Magnetospirillum sp.]
MPANPVLVEIRRFPLVESRHRGAAVVADADGAIVAAWGDGSRPVYPRSALKPIQALALAESGALAAFGLGGEELALATASHAGEPVHVEGVAAWLARIGLSEADLECGAHPPSNPQAARALRGPPSPLHNNCSGKHAGFLTLARHLGVATTGYVARTHPVQRRVSAIVAALSGGDVDAAPTGTDGCGIPVHALPLTAVATAMARLGAPDGLPPQRAGAARAVVAAMLAHPHLVAGSGRLCSELMAKVPRLIAKGGAEGVYTAALPARGLGIALKIDDGAGRAAEVALLAVLDHLGALRAEDRTALAARLAPPVLSVAGAVVGEMRAVL